MEGLNRLGLGAYTSQAPPAIIQSANQTIEQKIATIQQVANTLMLNVATNRKQLYDLILELKNHHKEYGFESPAKAVETVIKRSKRWANRFVADLQEEAGIEVAQVAPPEKLVDDEPEEEGVGQTCPTQKLVDKTGLAIPDPLIPMVERRKEVTAMAHYAAKLRSFFEELQTKDDPIYRHLLLSGNVQTFMSGTGQMHYQISECLPDVVCPVCQGSRSVGDKLCHECSGSGFISKHHWHQHWVKARDENKQLEVKRRAEQRLPAES